MRGVPLKDCVEDPETDTGPVVVPSLVALPQRVPALVGVPDPIPVELPEGLPVSEPLPLPIELPLKDWVEHAETLVEPLKEGKEGLATPLGLTDPDELGEELWKVVTVCATDSDMRPVALTV